MLNSKQAIGNSDRRKDCKPGEISKKQSAEELASLF